MVNAICYFSSDKVDLKEVIDLGLEVSICRASLVFFVVLHEYISLIRHIIHSECTLYVGFLAVCSACGGYWGISIFGNFFVNPLFSISKII